jgi:hypothetical protein
VPCQEHPFDPAIGQVANGTRTIPMRHLPAVDVVRVRTTPRLVQNGQMSEPSRSLVVDVLYFEVCPNYTGAGALAERVSNELGIDAQVRLQQISDPEAAIRARFLGSSTIRVNGHDIEPDADRRDDYVHACRLYPGEHGLRGLPDEDWLRQALIAAQARP